MAAVTEADFATCLRPVRAVLKFFGLETFQLATEEIPGSSRRYVFIRSFGATAYYVLISFAVLSIHAVHMHELIYGMSYHFSPSVLVSSIVSSNLTFITALVSLVLMRLKSKERLEIINRFEEVDKMMLQCSQEHYRNWSKHSTICFVLVFAVVCFTFGTTTVGNVSKHKLTFIGEDSFNFIVLAMLTDYVNSVLLVRQRIRMANQLLQKSCILKAAEHVSEGIPVRTLTNVCSVNRRRRVSPYGCNLNIDALLLLNPASQVEDERRMRARISSVGVIHSKLHGITSLINSAYGVPVLFCILFFSSGLTLTLHFALKMSLTPEILANTGVTTIVNITFWTLQYLAQTAMIIYSCSTTRKEASLTRDIVQRLLLRSGTDKRTVSALWELSKQISKRDMTFTAAEFFTLDLPLFATMAWVVVSYILVLIQIEKL